MSSNTNESVVGRPRKEVIVVVDDNDRYLSSCRRWLGTKGFQNVKCVQSAEEAIDAVQSLGPELVLIDIHLGQQNDGLELLQSLRTLGFRGLAVVVSGDSSREQCFRAAKAGANDFLLKRPQVRIADEVERIFKQAADSGQSLSAASLSDLGYLHSFDLTEREITLIEEFAKDYPSHKVMAERLYAAPTQLRKAFTRIYKKLGIESSGQLIHVLTVCSMFHSRGMK